MESLKILYSGIILKTFTYENIVFLLMQDPSFKDKQNEVTDKN